MKVTTLFLMFKTTWLIKSKVHYLHRNTFEKQQETFYNSNQLYLWQIRTMKVCV